MEMRIDVLRKLKMSRVTLLLLFLTLGIGSLTVSSCTHDQHSGMVPHDQIPLRVVSGRGSDGYITSTGSDADVYRSGIQALGGRRLMATATHLHFHRFPRSVTANNLDNPAVRSIGHNPEAAGSQLLHSKDEFRKRSLALLNSNPDLNSNGKSTEFEEVFHEDYTQAHMNLPIIQDPEIPILPLRHEEDYVGPGVHPPAPDEGP